MQSENRQLPPGSRIGQDWHRSNCYGCGPDNPNGLGAVFPFDEQTGEVRFEYTAREFATGAPGYTHGGVLASIMDEAQGVLCFHVGHLVMTDRLRMKYHKATPLGEPFHVRCWISAVRKRRLYTRGTIHSAGDELLVSSSAVWYLLPERVAQRLFYGKEVPGEQQRVRNLMEANRKRAKEIRKRIRDASG